jgi:hypothetical protein
MKCTSARKLLPLLAGGELETFRREEIEQHLSLCTKCRQEYGEYQTLLELSHSVPPLDVPDEFRGSLVRTIMDQRDETHKSRFTFRNREDSVRRFRFRDRMAAVTAVTAVALIATFVALGIHFFRGSLGPGVEDYLLRSDLKGLSSALMEETSRERLLDQSISIDLLIQTVENLQRNRTFHERIELHIAKSLREIKNTMQEDPGKRTLGGSRSVLSPITYVSAGSDGNRFENILRTLRHLRRSDDRVTVREILRGLEIVMET